MVVGTLLGNVVLTRTRRCDVTMQLILSADAYFEELHDFIFRSTKNRDLCNVVHCGHFNSLNNVQTPDFFFFLSLALPVQVDVALAY